MKTQIQLVKEIMSNVNSSKGGSMKNVNEINAWYKANGHLLEEEVVLLQEDAEFREAAAAIKSAIYDIDDTGRRRGGVKATDLESEVNESSIGTNTSYLVDEVYFDVEKEEFVEIMDDEGIVGSILRKSSSEIGYGRAQEVARFSLFEDGFGNGVVRVVDDRGNYVGNMTYTGELSYRYKEEAITRRLVKELEARCDSRQKRKEVANSVLAYLVNQIKESTDYKEISEIIRTSHEVLRGELKVKCNTTYVVDNCKYVKDGKETTLNSWYLSHFTKSLWNAVNESKWKAKREDTFAKYNVVYEKVQSALDSIPASSIYELADLLRSGKGKAFGISKEDARMATVHASKNKGRVRPFSKQVFFALISYAQSA